MTYVGASVDDLTKADWEGYLAESQYGSMSELVRAAVRKEVRDTDMGQDVSAGGSVEIDRLQEQQQETLTQLDELKESIQEATEQQESTEYPEEIVQLGHEIASDLDTISEAEFIREFDAPARVEGFGRLEREYGAGDTAEVKAAFDYLEENISWIRKRPARPSDYYRVKE